MQPGTKRRIRSKLIELVVGLHEGILYHFFRQLRASHQAQGRGVSPALMGFYQRPKSMHVPAPYLLEQLGFLTSLHGFESRH
jgi:hypothetical protein